MLERSRVLQENQIFIGFVLRVFCAVPLGSPIRAYAGSAAPS